MANVERLKRAQKMYFDVESRFLACYGNDTVNIISMDPEINGVVMYHQINKSMFAKIVDLQLVSYDFDKLRCDVACQSKENQNVVVYDISQTTPDYKRVITYLSQKSNDRVKVKIAEDFKKVAMSYGNENYILTIDDNGHQN